MDYKAEQKMQQRIVLDFDGTIATYNGEFKSPEQIDGTPIKGTFEFIEKLIKDGYKVCISSSRMSEKSGISAIKEWFINYNFKFESELEYSYGKLPAHLYVDDRAFTFNGTYPSISYVKNFKPYHERNRKQ